MVSCRPIIGTEAYLDAVLEAVELQARLESTTEKTEEAWSVRLPPSKSWQFGSQLGRLEETID
jgi:hypothetical protein